MLLGRSRNELVLLIGELMRSRLEVDAMETGGEEGMGLVG